MRTVEKATARRAEKTISNRTLASAYQILRLPRFRPTQRTVVAQRPCPPPPIPLGVCAEGSFLKHWTPKQNRGWPDLIGHPREFGFVLANYQNSLIPNRMMRPGEPT